MSGHLTLNVTGGAYLTVSDTRAPLPTANLAAQPYVSLGVYPLHNGRAMGREQRDRER